MALNARNVPDELIHALIAAANQRQVDALSTSFHLTRTERTNRSDYRNQSVSRVAVSTANATDLATSLTLVNEIKDVVDEHFADAVAHDSATSAAITIADATDLASAVTLANDLKAKYNTHRTASNVHYTNDSTNSVTNADATDQSTLNTLINEIKGDVNAHIASAPAGTYITVVGA